MISRNDVDQAKLGWTNPRWGKCNMVESAIVFMAMKGKPFHMIEDNSSSEDKMDTPSQPARAHSVSPKKKQPV